MLFCMDHANLVAGTAKQDNIRIQSGKQVKINRVKPGSINACRSLRRLSITKYASKQDNLNTSPDIAQSSPG